VVQKEWLMPIKRQELAVQERPLMEKQLRHPNVIIRSDYAPASFFVAMIKELIRQKWVTYVNWFIVIAPRVLFSVHNHVVSSLV